MDFRSLFGRREASADLPERERFSRVAFVVIDEKAREYAELWPYEIDRPAQTFVYYCERDALEFLADAPVGERYLVFLGEQMPKESDRLKEQFPDLRILLRSGPPPMYEDDPILT